MSTTAIKNADWIVAWDEDRQQHGYLRGADLVFSGNTIVFVGHSWEGVAQTIIDGSGLMVMPGLVDVHSHASIEPFFRGLREDHGVPQMWMSGLYERSQAYRPEADVRNAGKTIAYCELLTTGTTTVVDLSAPDEGWVDLAAASGLRVVLGPNFASARWCLTDEWKLGYQWNVAGGEAGLDNALALITEAKAHTSGRLSGIMSPAQIDTCTPELLQRSHAAAIEREMPFTVHCAQGVNEFNEIVHRTGLTPIQWANGLGILGRSTILGHAIFTDEHSWLNWHTRRDKLILADSGTNVAHCPTPFARYGQMLESLGGYEAAGINVGLGTDVAPHNLIEELRLAAILARVSCRDITSVNTASVFHAATIGGAKALGRSDIGLLREGAKADFVLVDLQGPFMRPARDPLRSLVFGAADRAITSVYVDGLKVVEGGRAVHLELSAAQDVVAEGQARMMHDSAKHDFRGRLAHEITPLSLPVLERE